MEQCASAVLRGLNSDNARKVSADAPTDFIKPRWQKLVMIDTGIDRRDYELCALSEMKNALRPISPPVRRHWGEGITSSSDGQNFRTGSKAEGAGHINPK